MAKLNAIPGFDYVAGKPVAYTAKEWREKYPPKDFVRLTNKAEGETWYRYRNQAAHFAAEAYAIIPAGRATT
jgi:hypothetical protein